MAKKELYRYIMPMNDGQPAQSIASVLEDVSEHVVEALRYKPCLIEFRGEGRRKIRITIKVETV